MPAVVLPSSPALRNFGHFSSASPVSNGGHRDDMSVAEIKEKVKLNVLNVRGASPISLLKTARNFAVTGFEKEESGDAPGSLNALLTAAELSKLAIDSEEFKKELKSAKKGVVYRDFVDYHQQYGSDVISRATRLENRLLELERNRSTNGSSKPDLDGLIEKPGGSIADRVKSLQEAGMSVSSKRFSRDVSPGSSNVVSRASSSHGHSAISSPPSSHTHFSSLSNNPTGSSAHSFVAPSALGPPSPASSSSSPPPLSHGTISEFNQAYPPIDELDEIPSGLPTLPSVPTTKPGSLTVTPLASPSVISRFPSVALDLDATPRPSSTPITPSVSSVPSRPPSPPSFHRTPLSPAIPPKPAKLSTGSGYGSSSSAVGKVASTRTSPSHTGDHLDFPVTNSLFPKQLRDYLTRSGNNILLLDVRPREEFSKGHIKANAVVCLDPYVLNRDGLNGERLEDTLSVAPRHESALFRNRNQFDLVVMYDESSESFGASISPMSIAVRIIYEHEFNKMLKKPPVILVGGIKAWKSLFPTEITRDDATPSPDIDIDRRRFRALDLSPSLSQSQDGAYDQSQNQKESLYSSSAHVGIEQVTRDSPNGHVSLDGSQTQEPNGVPPSSPDLNGRFIRRVGMTRPPSMPSIPYSTRGLYETSALPLSPLSSGSQLPPITPITYPQFSKPSSSSSFGTSLPSGPGVATGIVSPPPQASINPSPLSRRRTDYIDQSEQAVSNFANRPAIDYPDLSAQHVVRPPPAVAAPPGERQDSRPRMHSHSHTGSISLGPKPPVIASEYPVHYWPDMQIATIGLKNLGNTCYMNSTIQCLSATVPFARFFTDGRWKSAVNMLNPLGSKGQFAQAFASICHDLWHEELPSLSPYSFRKSVCVYAKQFAGTEQHDSQEFLGVLLDRLHEDLNRVLQKPVIEPSPEREAKLETLPVQIASEEEWDLYKLRNDSIVVDFFQGQFRNRMECMTCHKTSTTYNTFMYLTLPIPAGRGISKVSLQQCLDAFVHEEVMEKSDAWNCPNCKTLRKATKRLSLSRLPPVLMIHLKRFHVKGPFTDKLETFVDFPLKGLDLTNYMPPPLPPGIERKNHTPINLDDPRTQVPPYRYDLYAVTNHFGTLSSGHYTAFINSRGGWLYCDDSRISTADAREVVGKPAYILFYKRVKP